MTQCTNMQQTIIYFLPIWNRLQFTTRSLVVCYKAKYSDIFIISLFPYDYLNFHTPILTFIDDWCLTPLLYTISVISWRSVLLVVETYLVGMECISDIPILYNDERLCTGPKRNGWYPVINWSIHFLRKVWTRPIGK
jgi:hypothetical protein